MEDASVEANAEHVAPVWEPSETEKWGMNESLDNDGKQCVRSLQEAFQWMLHFERGVARTWGEEAFCDLRVRVYRKLGSQSYATMFSGIDAPSTALDNNKYCCRWWTWHASPKNAACHGNRMG